MTSQNIICSFWKILHKKFLREKTVLTVNNIYKHSTPLYIIYFLYISYVVYVSNPLLVHTRVIVTSKTNMWWIKEGEICCDFRPSLSMYMNSRFMEFGKWNQTFRVMYLHVRAPWKHWTYVTVSLCLEVLETFLSVQILLHTYTKKRRHNASSCQLQLSLSL